MGALFQAVAFLTIVPVPRRLSVSFSAAAVAWFPLVGLLVGGVVATLDTGLAALPLSLRSILAIAAWVVLTGALHVDGWIDACDALAPGLSSERALTAMRDPRAGAMGVAGAVLLIVGKWSALSALAGQRAVWLVMAAVMARWCVALLLAFAPDGRGTSGMGARVAANVKPRHTLLPTAILSLGLFWLPIAAFSIAVLAAVLATTVVAALLWRRLGALTGDAYGAAVELAETAVLLTAVAMVRA